MDLYPALRRAFADNFVFYFKAHVAHWNVVGNNFPQYHKFLEDLNSELFEAVDPLAEHIRAIGSFTPNSLLEILQDTTIAEFGYVTAEPVEIFTALLDANAKTIDSLMVAFDAAMAANQQGLANFLSERVDVHQKHGWMLKAILGR